MNKIVLSLVFTTVLIACNNRSEGENKIADDKQNKGAYFGDCKKLKNN